MVEADEYAGNFDPYRPVIGVLTNADWDHPDVFPDRAAVVAAFGAWIRRFDGDGEDPVLVANAGDPGVREVLAGLRDWSGRLVAVRVVGADEDPAAAAVRSPREHATARGPATAIVGRWQVDSAGRGASRSPASRPRARSRLASVSPDVTTRRTASSPPARRSWRAPSVPAILDGLATLRRGRTPPRAEGRRRRRSSSSTTTGTTRRPWRRRSRPWPTAIPAGGCGRSTNRSPSIGPRRCSTSSPRSSARADRVVIADIHAGRDPDTTITSAQALADAVNARGGAPAWAPGSVECDRRLAGPSASSAATWSSSWAAAGPTSSPSGSSRTSGARAAGLHQTDCRRVALDP